MRDALHWKHEGGAEVSEIKGASPRDSFPDSRNLFSAYCINVCAVLLVGCNKKNREKGRERKRDDRPGSGKYNKRFRMNASEPDV